VGRARPPIVDPGTSWDVSGVRDVGGAAAVLPGTGPANETYCDVLRRISMIAFTAALVAGAAVASAAVGRDAAVVVEPAVRLSSHPRALLVSDSAWLGIKTYGAVDSIRGFEHMLDLASCRRRVVTSCRNYDGHVPIPLYEEVAWRKEAYDTLIVATGYNDSDQNFRSDVDTIVGLTRRHGYDRVVWLTLRENVSYRSPDSAGFAAVFARNNATLRELAASGDYPEIVVADWAVYARDRSEWFARDGIHLRSAGPWAAGDFISRKLAFLDGRPCAMPLNAGVAPQDPCPDPDATGAIVDLASIYPLDRPAPRDPFVLEWEGVSSWPGPGWWQN